MSERYGAIPPDEPVIGAVLPPPPPGIPAAPTLDPYDEELDGGGYAPEDEWEDEYDDGYEEEPYYDDYYDDAPARQPMFYVFVGLAALIGAAVVFLLFTVVRNNNDGGNAGAIPPTAAAKIVVAITSPAAGDRVNTATDQTVSVQAKGTDRLVKFQLFVQDAAVDEVAAKDPSTEGVYTASLRYRLDRRGEYTLFVRATSTTGATKDSDKIKISGIEDIGNKPADIRGRISATANLHNAPNDQSPSILTLNPGQDVVILGKSEDEQWLFVDVNGGGWVKTLAVDLVDSLALIPVRTNTPTPTVAPATPIPTPSPSATATPSSAPDFVPTDAQLIEGGARLRVTIKNISSNAFEGSIVVSAAKVNASPAEKAFGVKLAANGGTGVVEFELSPPVTSQKSVDIKVDPSNAIKETEENNNSATFVLTPPVEQPVIGLVTQIVGPNIAVTISNTGGPIASTDSRVVVTLEANGVKTTQDAAVTLALDKGKSVVVNVPKPQGSGQARVDLIVGGQVIATTTIRLE
ncbi:MAG: hypothetical protein HYX53_06495 [Chloroflexi bacterium]|nr:hypothetical protein [Chloroflexota bacterium]